MSHIQYKAEVLFLKAASLKMAPTMRIVGRAYIPRAGKEVKNFQLPRSRSHLFDDLLQQKLFPSCLLFLSLSNQEKKMNKVYT